MNDGGILCPATLRPEFRRYLFPLRDNSFQHHGRRKKTHCRFGGPGFKNRGYCNENGQSFTGESECKGYSRQSGVSRKGRSKNRSDRKTGRQECETANFSLSHFGYVYLRTARLFVYSDKGKRAEMTLNKTTIKNLII